MPEDIILVQTNPNWSTRQADSGQIIHSLYFLLI